MIGAGIRRAPALAGFLAASCLARAQAPVAPADPKAIAHGLAEAGVIATVQWDAEGGGAAPIAVIAAAEGGGGRVRFYGGEPLATLSSYGEKDWTPAALFPACPVRCPLVTLWRAGFKLKLAVFAADRGEPRPVLEAELLAAPELLADPERSEPIFLLKAPPAAGSAPAVQGVEAQVWRWTDGRYEKVATAPWARRLSAVPGAPPPSAPARKPAPARTPTRR